jgi:hypothetical protein
VGTCRAIKDILTIMGNEQVFASSTRSPKIDDSVIKAGAHNFTRNSSDLEALNLLHDDLIIPCHRRKHQ